MNFALPAVAAAIISTLLSHIIAPFLASIVHAPNTPGAEPWCEGYYPPAELCFGLGSDRPAWHRRTRANARCPQWRID
eukprot:CAMPEP_0194342112 /NCGR_PEP_ID=MMETSP0171-20130528/91848_1 /TAXON_ID=218684 /ORGANISM="Corethron pennatum, Strain L29A3" /LENGTH=77 /DNA_ID=CAMNT_0039107711 /DNA_START=40 /DNA_END=270 /DNA_ORIENTATION=-